MHDADNACALARDSAGRSSAARMAIMAITTRSSINVNAISPLAPSFPHRAFARLPTSFPFMAVGYPNPDVTTCRWRCAPNTALHAARPKGAGQSSQPKPALASSRWLAQAPDEPPQRRLLPLSPIGFPFILASLRLGVTLVFCRTPRLTQPALHVASGSPRRSAAKAGAPLGAACG